MDYQKMLPWRVPWNVFLNHPCSHYLKLRYKQDFIFLSTVFWNSYFSFIGSFQRAGQPFLFIINSFLHCSSDVYSKFSSCFSWEINSRKCKICVLAILVNISTECSNFLLFFYILDLYWRLEKVEGHLERNGHLNYFTLTCVNIFLGKSLILP